MASAALVEGKVEAGKSLVSELDRAGFPVRSAFWLYSNDDESWRLVIASPLVRQFGPKEGYKRLRSLLHRVQGMHLNLSEISLVKDNEPLVDLLRKAVHTEGVSEIRFSGNSVNGVMIDDALIYRST
jgi:hypothetical protein